MITTHFFTPRLGLAPANSLTLVQHNSLGSWDVLPSLFSSFPEGSPVDIVLLQDPPSSKGFLPSFIGFKSFAPPVARPRVACYVSQKFLQRFAIVPFFHLEREKTSWRWMFSRCEIVFAQVFPALGLAIRTPDHSPLPPIQSPPSRPFWTLTTPTRSQAASTSTTQQPTPPDSSPPGKKANPSPTLTEPRI